MQQASGASSAQSDQDFAGLLAALAAAKPAKLPEWNEDELVQDVATLSYERALRTHGRYKSGTIRSQDSGVARPNLTSQTETHSRARRKSSADAGAGENQSASFDRKCASVTIRMSKAECEQLHARAAEAGLTISAYLRSCTFEAEALRAQVKEALAQLRNAPAAESRAATAALDQAPKADESTSAPNTKLRWLRNLIPDLHPARKLVRA
jgi:predicted DNA binding CopG/RHH family protein